MWSWRRGGEHAPTKCQKGAAGRGTEMREQCTSGWEGLEGLGCDVCHVAGAARAGTTVLSPLSQPHGRGGGAKAAPVTLRKYLFLSLTPDQVPSFENVLKTIR